MKKHLNNELGITLVEVVAAVALLTIILTSVYYILIQNSKSNAINKTNFTISTVARDLSAEITANCLEVTFDNFGQPSNSTCFPKYNPTNSTIFDVDRNSFPVRFTVEPEKSENKYNYFILRQVKIEVWNKGDDRNNTAPKATTYTYQREVID